MTNFKHKILSAALLGAGLMAVPAPAAAQARAIAVVDVDSAVRGSQAWQSAMTSIRSTYATQIQTAQTRSQAIEAELKPLVDAYNAAVQQPNATQASVTPHAQALQQKRQAVEAELGRLNQPLMLARAYVQEQIGAQFDASLQAAMAAKGVDLVLPANAILRTTNAEVNLTDEVVAELNRRVQSVSVQPPSGWQPGQQQQQQQPQGQ